MVEHSPEILACHMYHDYQEVSHLCLALKEIVTDTVTQVVYNLLDTIKHYKLKSGSQLRFTPTSALLDSVCTVQAQTSDILFDIQPWFKHDFSQKRYSRYKMSGDHQQA